MNFNLLKMIVVIICLFFLLGMLVASENSAQVKPYSRNLLDSSNVVLTSNTLQERLLDSNARQQEVKIELKVIKDSMNFKIIKNRKKVIAGFRELMLAAKKKDTVYVPAPINVQGLDQMFFNLN